MDCRDDLDEVAGLFEHGAHTVALDGMNHEAIMRKLLLDRIYHSQIILSPCALCRPLCHPERSRRVYKRFLDKLGMTGKGAE